MFSLILGRLVYYKKAQIWKLISSYGPSHLTALYFAEFMPSFLFHILSRLCGSLAVGLST